MALVSSSSANLASGAAAMDDAVAAQTTSAGVLSQVTKVKKKKKLTAKERIQEKLDKECDELSKDAQRFNELLQSVAYWLSHKQSYIQKLFHQQTLLTLDHEMFKEAMNRLKESDKKQKPSRSMKTSGGGGYQNDLADSSVEINTLSTVDFKITYDDFKLVVKDLDIPCTKVQLHSICRLLDAQSTGRIDFRAFTPELLNSHIRRKQLDGIHTISGTERTRMVPGFTFKSEPTKVFAAQYPLYVKLDIKLLTFATDKEYKGHVRDEVVYTHIKVFSLLELIKQRTGIVSEVLQLYQDTTRTRASVMEESKMLEQYGHAGAPYNDTMASPAKVTLFFDYKILGNDDPVLNCDFYFHDYKYTKKH